MALEKREKSLPEHHTQIESLESSSPLVTRAVACGLMGKVFNPYLPPAWQRALLGVLGKLPQAAGRFAIMRYETFSGLNPSLLMNLSIESLAEARIRDYAGLEDKYPAITIGAALGGASAFLSLALNGPFLPQAFVTTLKGGSSDGEVSTYLQRSAGLALQITQNNPGLFTIQHYDPIHDEWMTRRVNHLRFKLLRLPEAYRRFIRRFLAPEGAVCYLDCGAQWLRYRIGERSVFQVGGWGGIPADEFLNGSERIRRYAESVGLKHTDWRLFNYPLESGPESEWGSEPGLGEALESLCSEEGYRFIRISLPEPHHFSLLAFQSMARLLQMGERQPAGVLVEMFSQFDPGPVLNSGLLPLWLIFNTWDSLAFLKRMSAHFPMDKPVFFSPLSTFTQTPDLVPWSEWEGALQGLDWRNLGTRPSHYPADLLTLIDWAKPLREWAGQNHRPVNVRLTAEELFRLAGSLPNSLE
jgi:hypothetical protein